MMNGKWREFGKGIAATALPRCSTEILSTVGIAT
jgi:hypothetical protein